MNISPENLYKNIKNYLVLVDRAYKNKEHKKITFSKGYYWSEIEELQILEKTFLQTVSKNKKYILGRLKTETQDINKSMLLHLLGWSRDYKNTPKILSAHFSDKNTTVANAAARALFPMVANGSVALPVKDTYKLLKRKSKYLKNKALGLIAFSGDTAIKEIEKLISSKYLEKLADSKEGMVSGTAKLVIEKFNSIHRRKA